MGCRFGRCPWRSCSSSPPGRARGEPDSPGTAPRAVQRWGDPGEPGSPLAVAIHGERTPSKQRLAVAGEHANATAIGVVTIQDPHAVDTQAAFSVGGHYALSLTASDGLASKADSLRVTVFWPVTAGGPSQRP